MMNRPSMFDSRFSARYTLRFPGNAPAPDPSTASRAQPAPGIRSGVGTLPLLIAQGCRRVYAAGSLFLLVAETAVAVLGVWIVSTGPAEDVPQTMARWCLGTALLCAGALGLVLRSPAVRA